MVVVALVPSLSINPFGFFNSLVVPLVLVVVLLLVVLVVVVVLVVLVVLLMLAVLVVVASVRCSSFNPS